jgi:hypothetical protein
MAEGVSISIVSLALNGNLYSLTCLDPRAGYAGKQLKTFKANRSGVLTNDNLGRKTTKQIMRKNKKTFFWFRTIQHVRNFPYQETINPRKISLSSRLESTRLSILAEL